MAKLGISVLGITGDVVKGAAIIVVAVVIGPTIAPFAPRNTSRINRQS